MKQSTDGVRPKMALCCLPNFDNFIDDLIPALEGVVQIERVVSQDPAVLARATSEADLIWIEWGNQLAEYLTHQGAPLLKGKRVLCRIHSYEVLDNLVGRIDFSKINDLIFVAKHICDIFQSQNPAARHHVERIHCIPNGIDLQRFPFHEREPGHRIAYLGTLNHKKDPMVLLHAFRQLHQSDNRFELHLAGSFQEQRYVFAMETFIQQNQLSQAVTFHGHQQDVVGWLADKQFVLCSSLMEGHPVGLMEAMATGCRPLIYAFPGAGAMYPAEYLWGNLEELVKRAREPLEPRSYRHFIEKHYSLEIQAERVRTMLTSEETVSWVPLCEETGREEKVSFPNAIRSPYA